MVRAQDRIDVSSLPELARVADEVARSQRSHVLQRGTTAIAIIAPVRSRRKRERSTIVRGRVSHRGAARLMTAAQREAVLASVGGWKGLVDAEQLKRDLDAARGDDRPPITL